MAKLCGIADVMRQFAEGHDFASPKKLISDLTEQQALRQPDESPYSIAVVVAHMHFWQERWIALIDGTKPTSRRGRNSDWPTVKAGAWTALRKEFLNGVEASQSRSKDRELMARTSAYNVTGEQLATKIALHNAYHLGEIALLRQLLGLWPPKDASEEAW